MACGCYDDFVDGRRTREAKVVNCRLRKCQRFLILRSIWHGATHSWRIARRLEEIIVLVVDLAERGFVYVFTSLRRAWTISRKFCERRVFAMC